MTKTALISDTSLDPNYNEIEEFVIDLISAGYDPIDVLIMTRETFDHKNLDAYLYEMRDKGVI